VMSDKWPKYLPDKPSHFHALGVIATTYNFLEYRVLGLLLLYVGFSDMTTFLFQRLKDNTARLDLLKKAVFTGGETVEIKDAVQHFCTGFDRCAQNRNILMHSLAYDGPSSNALDQNLVFAKAAKHRLKWNRVSLSLVTLRRVADETKSFSDFGRKLFNHITTTYRREELKGPYQLPPPDKHPFPEKPELPELLSLQ
jgi:hypothetical protein